MYRFLNNPTKEELEIAIEQLQAARALLVRKEWNRGALAVRSNASPCSFRSPEATAFCALGALYRYQSDSERGPSLHHPSLAKEFLNKAIPLDFKNAIENIDNVVEIFHYNDAAGVTKADILALYQRAINAARAALAEKENAK